MLIDAMEERRVASSTQVAELLAKGFTLYEVVEAGFSKYSILKPVNVITGTPLINEEDYLAAVDALATSDALSVQNGSANPKSGSATTTVVVVCILAAVLVVVGAAIFVSRNRNQTEGSTPSFSNPAFENAPTSSAAVAGYMAFNPSGAAQSAGYMDVNSSAQSAGYMDVNPSATAPSTGYMDVTPSAATQSAGYMDVQASEDAFGGFESASQSDEEV